MKISVLWGILIICFTTSLSAQETTTDSVTVTFEVVVPQSTPDSAHIFWAGSLNNWDPGDQETGFGAHERAQPLTYRNGHWELILTEAKGSEHTYKYTRGSVYSSEEKADFTYRPTRTVVFDKHKTVRDTVEAWHDLPPESIANAWPLIQLDITQINITYNGIARNGSGTILYDQAMGSQFYDFSEARTMVKNIPEKFFDTVYYYLPISATTNDLLLVSAARTSPEGPWHLYVDQNDNKAIDEEEQVFTIPTDTSKALWSGTVPVRHVIDGSSVRDSVIFTIRHAPDLPAQYRSSTIPGAPDLTYELPFKQRKGVLNGAPFYLSAPFESTFSDYFQLLIDHNENDTLETGAGSDEVYTDDLTQMYRKQKFYLFSSFELDGRFWQVADIDPHGRWIRLRPARAKESREAITEGTTAPQWKAATIKGDTLSSKRLQGKYVLLDFWGSWCGPCIQQIPLLKKAYHRFKDQDFEIIGFAYENEHSLDQALKEYRLPWPQVLDETGDYSSQFLVRGYPSYFLIGPDGIVLEMDSSLKGKQLIPTLEKYLE